MAEIPTPTQEEIDAFNAAQAAFAAGTDPVTMSRQAAQTVYGDMLDLTDLLIAARSELEAWFADPLNNPVDLAAIDALVPMVDTQARAFKALSDELKARPDLRQQYDDMMGQSAAVAYLVGRRATALVTGQ